jgi:YidC/Oxa1 family membrane protein insertase
LYNTIINPIASLLGKIMDILFTMLDAIGLGNIALAIILFTIIVKLCMLPLTLKQSKMTKLNSVIQPEIKAIQEKYKGKTGDPNAAAKMQEETKAVYEKYGTSMMGGCWQLVIQFPILMALYRVFQRIPIYITELKQPFINFLGNGSDIKGIMDTEGFAEYMSENFVSTSSRITSDWTNLDDTIVAMNSFTADQWNTLKEHFAAYADIITENQHLISDMNTTLFGINVSQVPTFGLNVSILIPILAGLSQYISVKITQGKQEVDDENPAAASMKMMMIFMPIMSAFIAFSVPAGLGLYWIATAVISTIIQLIVNRYYDKLGVDAIVAKNVEKRNKKRAKKGLPPEQISKNATASTKNISSADKNKDRIEKLQAMKDANDQKVKDIKESAGMTGSAKKGSLADKANMVARYNEQNKNKK